MFDKNQFDWIQFYGELANKLLDFKDNRKQLVDDVYSIYKTPGIVAPPLVQNGTLIDIDPFTFFSFFNRGLSPDHRKNIIKVIREFWTLSSSVPTSLDGIPTTNNNTSIYYNVNSSEYKDEIDTLWNLFEAAINYSNGTTDNRNLVSEYFDQAMEINDDSNGKITSGLFWIAPDVYLNLDTTNVKYIYTSGKIPQKVVDTLPLKSKSNKKGDLSHKLSADTYFEIVDKISGFLQNVDINLNNFHNFYELSYEAYVYKNDNPEKKEGGKGDNKPLANVETGPLDYEQIDTNKDSKAEDTSRATGGSNTLYYGVPGAGKSHKVDEEIGDDNSKVERVVFYPDYTYSDFVGQILPRRVKGEGGEEDKLEYPFVPGPFTRVLEKAIHDCGNKYYLVIEEINRGNAPAIFGDIFQLLDRKENGEGKYSITNYDIADYIYKNGEQKVQIPSNLTLYATMNTSDQNVFTLDTAFQRRWDMQLIPNDINQAEHANQQIEGSEITWGVFATTINKEILSENKNMISSEDKRLGAYFITKDELNKKQFAEKVLKYLWDDAFKMNREDIFDESLSSLEDIISTYESAKGDSLKVVLKPEIYSKMSQKTNEPDTQEGNNEQNQD